MFTHRKAISGSINFFLFLWSLPCLPQFSWNGGFSNRHFKFSFRDGSRQNAITDGSGESPGHVEIQGFPGSSKGCQKSVDVLLWLVNYVWHVLVDNQCLLTHGNGGSGLAFQISTFLLHVNSSASWSMGSLFFIDWWGKGVPNDCSWVSFSSLSQCESRVSSWSRGSNHCSGNRSPDLKVTLTSGSPGPGWR